MAKPKKDARADSSTAANVGYEAQLWQMADALRGSMDAASRSRPGDAGPLQGGAQLGQSSRLPDHAPALP